MNSRLKSLLTDPKTSPFSLIFFQLTSKHFLTQVNWCVWTKFSDGTSTRKKRKPSKVPCLSKMTKPHQLKSKQQSKSLGRKRKLMSKALQLSTMSLLRIGRGNTRNGKNKSFESQRKLKTKPCQRKIELINKWCQPSKLYSNQVHFSKETGHQSLKSCHRQYFAKCKCIQKSWSL